MFPHTSSTTIKRYSTNKYHPRLIDPRRSIEIRSHPNPGGKGVDVRRELRRRREQREEVAAGEAGSVRRRRSADEDKVIPSLQMIEEPPHSLEVMEGEPATLSCQASSSNTENIGYSWEFEDADSQAQVYSAQKP